MAIIYQFPGGPPDNDSLRERASEEGVSFDPQRVITIGPRWKGYTGIDQSDLSQSEEDSIMSALVDMTGQNVSGPYTRDEVRNMRPAYT